MEIHRSWRSWDFKKIFGIVYFVALFIYLVVGLTPAKASDYEAATEISIPAIDLRSDVVTVNMVGNELPTPEEIVGRFTWAKHKTLLIGHASTVFPRLKELQVGSTIYYDGDIYTVSQMEILAKADISMNKVLAAAEQDTIIIMTCAGKDLGGGDATHRLIVTAVVNE
ncbi:class F sortase [Candidatus Saccharibacteria bacterium]|nr:class F sortase [Candidatus Saccharibacteria bacterium]